MLKKLFMVAMALGLSLALLAGSMTVAFAATGATGIMSATSATGAANGADSSGAAVVTNNTVTLSKTQTEFVIPLVIKHQDAFAGVELAIQTPAGVKVNKVVYDTSQSQAGPTVARGLVWFSTFAGNNNFAGDLTATVHLTYTGSTNTQLVIDHAAFYSKDSSNGAATFTTQNVELRTAIAINKQGASNSPEPLKPPPAISNTKPGAGNPASSSAVGTDIAAGSGQATTATLANTANSLAGSAADISDALSAGAYNASGEIAAATPPSTSIPSTPTPLAQANSIPDNAGSQVNTLLLVFAIVCLLAVVALGCLLIAKRRKKDRKVILKEEF